MFSSSNVSIFDERLRPFFDLKVSISGGSEIKKLVISYAAAQRLMKQKYPSLSDRNIVCQRLLYFIYGESFTQELLPQVPKPASAQKESGKNNYLYSTLFDRLPDILGRYTEEMVKVNFRSLTDKTLCWASIKGVKWDGITVSRVNFSGATFEDCSAKKSQWTNVSLVNTSMSICLEGAILEKVALDGAQLSRADLTRSTLKGVGLKGTVLEDCDPQFLNPCLYGGEPIKTYENVIEAYGKLSYGWRSVPYQAIVKDYYETIVMRREHGFKKLMSIRSLVIELLTCICSTIDTIDEKSDFYKFLIFVLRVANDDSIEQSIGSYADAKKTLGLFAVNIEKIMKLIKEEKECEPSLIRACLYRGPGNSLFSFIATLSHYSDSSNLISSLARLGLHNTKSVNNYVNELLTHITQEEERPRTPDSFVKEILLVICEESSINPTGTLIGHLNYYLRCEFFSTEGIESTLMDLKSKKLPRKLDTQNYLMSLLDNIQELIALSKKLQESPQESPQKAEKQKNVRRRRLSQDIDGETMSADAIQRLFQSSCRDTSLSGCCSGGGISCNPCCSTSNGKQCNNSYQECAYEDDDYSVMLFNSSSSTKGKSSPQGQRFFGSGVSSSAAASLVPIPVPVPEAAVTLTTDPKRIEVADGQKEHAPASPY